MKYCINCYNAMPDKLAFCPRCGTHQGGDLEYITSFDKYMNMSIKGLYNNTLELTPKGVHIYCNVSIFRKAYDKLIPYNEILSVEFTNASILTNGLLSVITHEAGLTGWKPPFSMRDTKVISEEQNTLMFNSKYKKNAQEIYEAINEICLHGFDFGEICNEYEVTESQMILNNYIEVDYMDGHEFEYFCADVLKTNGFNKVSVTPASGDQGVDVLAEKDGVKYAIQCKNYSSPLGNTPVQEVNAGKTFYKCHVGVVMTNSTFTKGAVELAESTGVLLWDREKILSMIK